MIFNNINISEHVKILRVRHTLLPPVTNLTRRIPGQQGTKHIRTELGERYIDVELGARKANKSELREFCRNLAGLLYTEGPQKLYFCDEPDKYYMAKLNGSALITEFHGLGKFNLQFLCNDPFAYGELKTLANISGKKLINNGSYPAKGIITVTMTESAEDLEITLLNTGELLYIEDDFAAEDIIVIDLENEYITKNGYSAMANLYLESDFFELPVGDFEISASAGTADLEFRERWL